MASQKSGVAFPQWKVQPLNAALILGGSVAGLALAGSAIAFWFGGEAAAKASLVAVLSCAAASVPGLLLVSFAPNSESASGAALLGMLPRVALPIFLGLMLQRAGGELAQAGVFEMILAYYFILLVIDTFLIVGLVNRWGTESLPAGGDSSGGDLGTAEASAATRS